MKHLIFVLCILLIFSFVVFSNGSDLEMLRIRVVGNSDDTIDQNNKIKVWERVEEEIEKQNFESLDEAKLWVENNIESIKEISEKTLKDVGSDADTRVFLREEYYEKEFLYPAGVYESLVIEIGKARGHNVWSLIFPDVALSLSAGKTENGFLLVRRDTVLKVGFKSLELLNKIFKDL